MLCLSGFELYSRWVPLTGVKGCSKIRRVLAKSRLILDEMCRLYGKFASYLRRVLFSRIFPRINGPNMMFPGKVFVNQNAKIFNIFLGFKGKQSTSCCIIWSVLALRAQASKTSLMTVSSTFVTAFRRLRLNSPPSVMI